MTDQPQVQKPGALRKALAVPTHSALRITKHLRDKDLIARIKNTAAGRNTATVTMPLEVFLDLASSAHDAAPATKAASSLAASSSAAISVSATAANIVRKHMAEADAPCTEQDKLEGCP